MHRLGRYSETDSMSSLISDNYSILLVMSRFGISLGFGDKNIGEVCRDNDVDTQTFLTVANVLLADDDGMEFSEQTFSLESLMGYLHNSHSYFLDFRLPAIRAQLVKVVGTEDNLARAIVSYFDEYVAEVQQHMNYEEVNVFPYVKALLAGCRNKDYSIDIFSRQHNQIEARLTEFKNILIKYYPAKSTNEINSVLFDIFSCEEDLASHNAIEDNLFVPAIAALENKEPKR